MSTYTISRNGEQFGPYAEADLHTHINNGHILPDDLAWKEGMAAWLPASQIFSFGAQRSSAAAPPPPIGQSYSSVAPTSVPTPPGLHWGLVLLFSFLTLGIFGWVWLFIQQNWLKKIAPETQTSGVMYLVGYIVSAVAANMASTTGHPGLSLVFIIAALASLITWVIGSGNAMRHYYNQVEPIGLRLSTPMLVIFNLIYLQYHLHRIANWKKTGHLTAQ